MRFAVQVGRRGGHGASRARSSFLFLYLVLGNCRCFPCRKSVENCTLSFCDIRLFSSLACALSSRRGIWWVLDNRHPSPPVNVRNDMDVWHLMARFCSVCFLPWPNNATRAQVQPERLGGIRRISSRFVGFPLHLEGRGHQQESDEAQKGAYVLDLTACATGARYCVPLSLQYPLSLDRFAGGARTHLDPLRTNRPRDNRRVYCCSLGTLSHFLLVVFLFSHGFVVFYNSRRGRDAATISQQRKSRGCAITYTARPLARCLILCSHVLAQLPCALAPDAQLLHSRF